jgi:hypothetical protein
MKENKNEIYICAQNILKNKMYITHLIVYQKNKCCNYWLEN